LKEVNLTACSREALAPNTHREFKRDFVPLFEKSSPFPLSRGRGIKGDGVNK
jgi:hypothetical protein